MLGIIYLLLSLLLGFVIISFAFPQLSSFGETTYRNEELEISSMFFVIPAWMISGLLVMNWGSYLFACFFASSKMALLYADEMVMIISIPIIVTGLFLIFGKHSFSEISDDFKKITVKEKIVFSSIAVLFIILFTMSFKTAHGQSYVGLTVFSDFTPHISMIRSFSLGHNFPTEYSVCAGYDVKYHFMFEFWVGNLEFLGIPLDWAFNLPSLIGVVGMYSLLYGLACKITGKKAAGMLSLLFLTFRSSIAVFAFLANKPAGIGYIKYLKSYTDFIGTTNHEDWGLWNLNVYLNQRHFAPAICIMLLLIILFLPILYTAFERITEDNRGIRSYISISLLNVEGWSVSSVKTAVFAGLLLGMTGFLNGAVVIGALIVLFFMAAVSDNRSDYVIMAVICGALVLLQSFVFIKDSAFETSFRYGFLADNPNLFGSMEFLLKLLGFLPIVLIIAFLISDAVDRYLLFAFSVPIIFAFNISLTKDIAVNHKYIMLAIMLLNIFAALFAVKVWEMKGAAFKCVCVVLVIALTLTGVYDVYTIYKRNNPKFAIVNNLNHPLINWIKDNNDSEDIFLTSNYYLRSSSAGSAVIYSGAKMYNAWQYFAWSSGYDTEARDEIVAKIYSGDNTDEIKTLLQDIKVTYVVIDRENRESDAYELNEEFFESNYPAVFRYGTGKDMISVYRVK